RSPSLSNASPLATIGCEPAVLAAFRLVGVTVIAPGGSDRGSRPTPPVPRTRFTSFDIGWIRNISLQPAKLGSHAPPARAIFQILPCPVVPSPVQRLPKRSKARPFVPGTPVAKAIASG